MPGTPLCSFRYVGRVTLCTACKWRPYACVPQLFWRRKLQVGMSVAMLGGRGGIPQAAVVGALTFLQFHEILL